MLHVGCALMGLLLHGSMPTTVFCVALCLNFLFAIYLFIRIYPYLPMAPKEMIDAPDTSIKGELLSIVFTNVLQSNHEADLLIKFISEKQPDLVLAVETDTWWVNTLSSALGDSYPAKHLQPQDNLYGMAFFTKLKVLDKWTHFQVQDDIPSFFIQLQTVEGQSFRFFGIHPRPPSPTEHEDSIPKDKELICTAKWIAQGDHRDPVIVGGDLNDVAWSKVARVFQKISGLLDPRRGRGFYPTFPAGYPLFRCPIDQVFCSEHFVFSDIEVGPNFGSDHLPLYISLVLNKEVVEDNDSLNVSKADHQLADEIIALDV